MDKELYYWTSQDGTKTPKDNLTDIHICHIVCKYGKDWLNENGHSVIVDRFNQLNKQYDFFKEVNRRKN